MAGRCLLVANDITEVIVENVCVLCTYEYMGLIRMSRKWDLPSHETGLIRTSS